MKVAFVQDWFTVDGGAEKVTREILKQFPEADVFSLIDFLNEKDRQQVLFGKRANVSPIQRFPMSRKHYRMYLPFFPGAIERFDLSSYDLIISSSYAVAKGVLTHSDQIHVCYCHSPMRYAWDLSHEYIGHISGPFGMKKFMARFFLRKIRIWDVVSSNRVDVFIANSKNVQNRIRKIYRRESEVIHPPVNTKECIFSSQKSDFYLAASRQVPYKNTELIIEAFKKMPDKKLVVCGDGPMLSKLKKLSGNSANIDIKGFVERRELYLLLSKAKGFIMAAHEDFGITPVEALASGTPVIGLAKGGLLEIVEEGKTGVFYSESTADAIEHAINQFEKSNLKSHEEIKNDSDKFGIERFVKEFMSLIERTLKE